MKISVAFILVITISLNGVISDLNLVNRLFGQTQSHIKLKRDGYIYRIVEGDLQFECINLTFGTIFITLKDGGHLKASSGNVTIKNVTASVNDVGYIIPNGEGEGQTGKNFVQVCATVCVELTEVSGGSNVLFPSLHCIFNFKISFSQSTCYVSPSIDGIINLGIVQDSRGIVRCSGIESEVCLLTGEIVNGSGKVLPASYCMDPGNCLA